jgi:hypothetical protein
MENSEDKNWICEGCRTTFRPAWHRDDSDIHLICDRCNDLVESYLHVYTDSQEMIQAGVRDAGLTDEEFFALVARRKQMELQGCNF